MLSEVTDVLDQFPAFLGSSCVRRTREGDLRIDVVSQNRSFDINESSQEVLLKIDGEHTVRSILEDFDERDSQSVLLFVKHLADIGAITFSSSPRSNHVTLDKPLYVDWKITRRCNLACKHCYLAAGIPDQNELTLEECISIVEQISDMGIPSITFVGGEPFARKSFLTIVRQALSRGIAAEIDTNGFAVRKEHFEELIALRDNLRIQVSLDGANCQAHDWFRGRQGSFDKAINCIKYLASQGLRVRVATVIHQRNIDDLLLIYQICRDLGVETWVLSPIQPLGRAIVNRNEIMVDSNKLIETLMQIDAKFASAANPRVVYPLSLSAIRLGNLKPSLYVCQQDSLGNSIVIHPNGQTSLCYRLDENCNHFGGNLRNISLRGAWENLRKSPLYHLRVDELKECGECKVRYLCGGGCRELAYHKTGSILGPDMDSCALMKSFMELWVPKLEENYQKAIKAFLQEEK